MTFSKVLHLLLLHNFKALMELCEVFPAVQSAKKAVEYAPTWWIAHQTLGRAYLGLGEVKMVICAFRVSSLK